MASFQQLYVLRQTIIAGASLERVQRVHLHPLKFGNGYNTPILNGKFSTGQVFSKRIEITPQIDIRKFEDHMH